MPLDIDMSELDDYLDRIKSLASPDVFAKVGEEAARIAGREAEKSYVDSYPERRGTTMKDVRGQSFLTAKQRRWFFASLRKGKLKLPYRRTGQLGRSLTSAPFSKGGKSGFYIGTNYKGAAYVIGTHDQQAAYHQDWWDPLSDRIEQNMSTIADAYRKMFVRSMTLYLRGQS